MEGSFSNVMSDHVRPTIHGYHAVLEERDAVPSVLAGPTCDSTDVITTGAMLPTLDVGDLVVAPFMGCLHQRDGLRVQRPAQGDGGRRLTPRVSAAG